VKVNIRDRDGSGPRLGVFLYPFLGFSWARVFPEVQAQDQAQVNKSNPKSRNRSRLFKNIDL